VIPSDIIAKKRDGRELKPIELSLFIEEFLANRISDAQMSALLMAIYFNGLTENELIVFVDEMIKSGQVLNFNRSTSYVADKHSTGGIGDKTSLILAPVMAAAGIKIPMIAGRGLEYTGGTIDKLEAIPGINIAPSLKTFKYWVDSIGCAIISQSKSICPADNKIYALRNLTATVPSIPIICSSIMSKKIAEGISGLVIDIKIGNGAFMKNKNKAYQLSDTMKKIARSYEINIDVIFSDMNQPLGRFAGLGCEIKEAIDCLKGDGSQDLINNTFELCSCLLIQSKKAKNKKEAKQIFDTIISSGRGFEVFEQMIKAQNGLLDEFYKKTSPQYEKIVRSNQSGTIKFLDTEKIGWCLVNLGCSKTTKTDKLDFTAGIEFFVKPGDTIKKGNPIYRVFNKDFEKLSSTLELLPKTVKICRNSV